MRKYVILFFTLILTVCQSFSQESVSEVIAIMDSNKIKVGDQTHLLLQATFPAGSTVIFPVLKDTLKGGISLVEIGEIDTSYDADDVKQKLLSQQLTITAWDSGLFPIEPFFFIINGDTLKTKALLLEVSNVQLDPNADIKDIKGIAETPFSFIEFLKENGLYFLGGIILLLIAAFIAKYLRSRPKHKYDLKKNEPAIPAHLLALEALEALDKKKLWQQDKVKAYYSELTHILRVYLEQRFEIHALEQTSDEIIVALKYTDIPELEKKKVMNVLLLSDMVKFAKEKPIGSENVDALAEVKKVIELTILDEVKVEPTKEAER